ncbi:hypothetical protein FE257_002992, partial [Aspergillus nanangensis]
MWPDQGIVSLTLSGVSFAVGLFPVKDWVKDWFPTLWPQERDNTDPDPESGLAIELVEVRPADGQSESQTGIGTYAGHGESFPNVVMSDFEAIRTTARSQEDLFAERKAEFTSLVNGAYEPVEGSISASQIQGITANSVFMNQVSGYWNAEKAEKNASPIICAYEYLGPNYLPIADDHINTNGKATSRSSWFQRASDLVLHRDAVSSAAIHTQVQQHVTRVGNAAQCLGEVITEPRMDNLRGLPILFVSGSENEVFKPESTLRDYEMLCRRFPATKWIYQRFVAEGYGHLDPIVGKSAEKDFYWRIERHLKLTAKDSEWCLTKRMPKHPFHCDACDNAKQARVHCSHGLEIIQERLEYPSTSIKEIHVRWQIYWLELSGEG